MDKFYHLQNLKLKEYKIFQAPLLIINSVISSTSSDKLTLKSVVLWGPNSKLDCKSKRQYKYPETPYKIS